MLTSKYWEDRYRAEEKARELADKRVAYQLNGVYQQHANNIQKEIDSFWQRYADKEGITKLEAKQRADRLDMVNVEFKARQLVERANRMRERGQKVTNEDFTKAENDLMRLYNLKMKTSRLEVLQANIKLHQYDLALSEFEIIDKHLTESIRRENLFSAGVLNMTIGSFETSKVSADTIIYANFNNATWSSRVWKRQGELRDIVKKGVADTVLRGKGTNVLINNLRKEFDVSYGYARRLAVTESARVYSEAQKANYEANGVEEFEIMTELKACKICQPFNGKIFKVSELVPALNAPPFHPNCRCTTVPHFKKDVKHEIQDYEKNDKTISKYNTQKLFSDVSNAWGEIGRGGLSKEQLVGLLESEYELGDFSSDITRLIGVSSAYIDVSSLATSLVRHGQQYSLDEFMLIKDAVQNPYLILDNSERVEKSIISYVKIPNKDKVIMEAVMVPRDEMLVIHFNKVGIRQVKKNEKNMLTLYKKGE
jgi:SPP1 gp7 family putative phage head morphogenesis protein